MTICVTLLFFFPGAGREFIHWFDLLDIVSPSKVNVAQLGGDTFLFVSYKVCADAVIGHLKICINISCLFFNLLFDLFSSRTARKLYQKQK